MFVIQVNSDSIHNLETDELQNVFNEYSKFSELPLTAFFKEIKICVSSIIQVFLLVLM